MLASSKNSTFFAGKQRFNSENKLKILPTHCELWLGRLRVLFLSRFLYLVVKQDKPSLGKINNIL